MKRATALLVWLLTVSVIGRSKPPPVFKGPHSVGGSNETDIVIPRCKHKISSPKYKDLMHGPACTRRDLDRADLCSLLANPPPQLPNGTMPASARLYTTRHNALLSVSRPGMQIVEVGTLKGQLARFIIRNMKPSKLVVFDYAGSVIHECQKANIKYALLQGNHTSVVCQAGLSFNLLSELPDDSFDIIYVDADHAYTSVCKGMRSKSSSALSLFMLISSSHLHRPRGGAHQGKSRRAHSDERLLLLRDAVPCRAWALGRLRNNSCFV